MQNFKTAFGVIAALGPVAYCGGLVYYFLNTSGSFENAQSFGLGPTVIGLTVVGLLFCIPVIVKLVRIFITPRSRPPGGRGGNDASKQDDFDADAVVARYMARRPAEAASDVPSAPPFQGTSDQTPRATFGRKIK